MSGRYQIEALLRPAVELLSAGLAFGVAAILALLHQHLYMPAPLAGGAAALALGYGLLRSRQGLRIVRYRRRLHRLPRFAMRRDRIPVSKHRLYVGKGFRWEAKHTQRLRDCLLPSSARFMRNSGIRRAARRLAGRLEHTPLAGLGACLDLDHPLNPLRPQPEVGGRPEIHGVGLYEGERNQYAPLHERVGHTLVLGTTRVGKTRFAEILMTQDIRRGDTVICFDPKGDADLFRSMYAACRDAGRLDRFHMFHLAYPEHSAHYNPIGEYSRITQVATRVANSLPGEGNSAAFREFGWRFVNVIAQALHVLGEKPTYAALRHHVNNIDNLLIRYGRYWLALQAGLDWQALVDREHHGLTGDREDPEKPNVPGLQPPERSHDIMAVCFARVLNTVMTESGRHDPVAVGLLSAFRYDKSYFDKITASLGPFLEKLTTGRVAELFGADPDGDRHTFDWLSVIRSNCVVYVGLAALQDVTVASAVGNAMFADLAATAGELYAYGANAGLPGSLTANEGPIAKVSIHADEFNELIGDEFIPMLNKAGGAGYQVTAYTQTWSDVEARIGSRAKAEQIAGNFNTVHMLRVRSQETAKLLTDLLPKVQVSALTTVSGAQHSTDPTSDTHFGSSVQDRVSTADVPMLEPGDLTRLPKGQSFMLKEGGQLYKLRLPLPAESGDIPHDIAALTERMRLDYHDTSNWHVDSWWAATMPDRVAGSPYGSGRRDEQPADAPRDAAGQAAEAAA